MTSGRPPCTVLNSKMHAIPPSTTASFCVSGGWITEQLSAIFAAGKDVLRLRSLSRDASRDPSFARTSLWVFFFGQLLSSSDAAIWKE